ncbi:MAG: LacI family DNA-binding transcriptional regulator [Betaproteobacteria bacterium]|nr:LacI family DNA-binding transcriptional regulator [Betaproteobacteria bacterium]
MSSSIKDVARVAGVSVATVSRALSGVAAVSPKLMARIEAAIGETGYRPNLSARRLRSRHSGTIGLILADLRNPFFTAVSRAVEDVAYQHGLRVILCNTDENPDKEAIYLKLMEEERVTGVIFAPTRQTAQTLDQRDIGFPLVLIDRVSPHGKQDAVVLDNSAASAMLMEHLHAQGYRRIAGIFGNASSSGIERHDGFVAAALRLGVEIQAAFVPPQIEAAQTEVRHLLERSERPQAWVASNGLLLMGVVRAVRAAGLVIPEDVAVAGFDNESWTELVGPGLTVIEQPLEAIGRTAMSILLERLANPALPPRKVLLGGRCVVRGSTAALAPGPQVDAQVSHADSILHQAL